MKSGYENSFSRPINFRSNAALVQALYDHMLPPPEAFLRRINGNKGVVINAESQVF